MCELYFELPSKKRQTDALSYVKEFIESGSDINGVGGLERYEDYDEWLIYIEDLRHGRNMPENYVRSSEYFTIRKKDDKIVGMVNIRHELNDFLIDTGFGHVGYGVRPDERRKGYATIQLRMALEKCRQLGINQVHVGCYEENIASRRTIEKNGGRLFRETVTDDKPYLEFVIDNE